MLVNSIDPILHKKTQLITAEQFANFKEHLQPTAEKLVKILYETNALGVSACQIGVDLSMFVMLVDHKLKLCVNPEIVGATVDMLRIDEMCLSYPGLQLKINRPDGVLARYFTLEGVEQTERLEGLEARVWLHEFDHCQGICFTDRVGPLSLKMAKKRLEKKRKHNKNAK